MDVGRDLPAKGIVEQVVFRCRGEVFRAAHDMGDRHVVIVDDIGEVIGRVAVGFEEDLVLQLTVFDRDVAIDGILEGGRAGKRHFLADNGRHPGSQVGLDDLGRQVAAMAVIATGEIAGCFSCGPYTLEAFLAAETMVSFALRHELLGMGTVQM